MWLSTVTGLWQKGRLGCASREGGLLCGISPFCLRSTMQPQGAVVDGAKMAQVGRFMLRRGKRHAQCVVWLGAKI